MQENQASQKKPCGEALSTESLHTMSSVELADALEQTLDTMTEEEYDPDLIDACLDALEGKAPIPEEPDPEEALREFQARLRSLSSHDGVAPVREEGSRVTRRKYPLKRVMVTVAATVALLFALMIGAQAAGLNIFGNLAQWTDELFFFLPSDKETARNSEYQEMFQDALEEAGMPTELAPGWYPEDFSTEGPETLDNEIGKTVESCFENKSGEIFFVSVSNYDVAVDFTSTPYEKDSNSVEIYTGNGRSFYIMSNLNTVTATWGNGNLIEIIRGTLSVDEVKKMINSMGG